MNHERKIGMYDIMYLVWLVSAVSVVGVAVTYMNVMVG